MPGAYLACVAFWSGRDRSLRGALTTATWSRGGLLERLSRPLCIRRSIVVTCASSCSTDGTTRPRLLVGGRRPEPPSCHFVDLESVVEYDSVITFRRIAAHVTVEDVGANPLGVALAGFPEAATAAGQ